MIGTFSPNPKSTSPLTPTRLAPSHRPQPHMRIFCFSRFSLPKDQQTVGPGYFHCPKLVADAKVLRGLEANWTNVLGGDKTTCLCGTALPSHFPFYSVHWSPLVCLVISVYGFNSGGDLFFPSLLLPPFFVMYFFEWFICIVHLWSAWCFCLYFVHWLIDWGTKDRFHRFDSPPIRICWLASIVHCILFLIRYPTFVFK